MSQKNKYRYFHGKSFYQVMYTHSFIYGYIDQVDNQKLSKLCIKNYKKRRSEDKNDTLAEDIIIPFSEEIKWIGQQMSNAYENKFGTPLRIKSSKDYWAQVHYKNESTQFHNHFGPNADIVGVYYVKVPTKSGDLTLKYKKHELDNSRWFFPPEENKFILFHAGVEHGVAPNQSNEPRVCISINFIINEKK